MAIAKGKRKAVRLEAFAAEIEQQRVRAYGGGGGKRALAGRTVKVVAQGDSWFSYFPAYDILATLRRLSWGGGWKYDVSDKAHAGALLNDMVYGRGLVETFQLLDRERPEAFIFSGGGNDIAGSELFVLLYNHKAVELHDGIPELNANILKGLVDEVFGQAYADLIDLVRIKLAQIGIPNIPILFHGYDYAIPDGRGWGGGAGPLPGPWLDPSLTRKGYDRRADADLRRTIVRKLIDAFNEMLKDTAASHPNTYHVDLRGTLADTQWGNELHPTERGFRLVTERYEAALRQHV